MSDSDADQTDSRSDSCKRGVMPLRRLKNRILARLFAFFPSLAERWAQRLVADEREIPWTSAAIPLEEATVDQ